MVPILMAAAGCSTWFLRVDVAQLTAESIDKSCAMLFLNKMYISFSSENEDCTYYKINSCSITNYRN